MPKDIHRFSHTRFDTLSKCPRKHHYVYVEQIETAESPYTIPGKLFHECLQKANDGEDIEPTIKEFETLCRTGKLDLDPDLLEYVVAKYLSYYKDDAYDEVLGCEKEFTDDLGDGDYLVCKVDKIIRRKGYVVVRDTKTTQNALKYTLEDVQRSHQLLIYVPYVEELLGEKVNAIEIDEVRMAKLELVPLKANGKPSTDKRQLGLVTYEDYLAKLKDLGIETHQEYQPILDYLKDRGHPLFRRTSAQILSQSPIANNAMQAMDEYRIAKLDPTFRNRGPLCRYCAYKELCDLDFDDTPSQASRDMVKEKIANSIINP